MPKLLEKKICKSENGKGKMWKSFGTLFGFCKWLFIYVWVTASAAKKSSTCINAWRGYRAQHSSTSPQRLWGIACAKNVGEWCDVRHTMCDVRHRGVQGVTLVTASVTLVTGATPVFLYFGLGFAIWFVFSPFCTSFPPFLLVLPNKPPETNRKKIPRNI